MNVLLCAPEYRPNLSNMIRSTEFFGLERIYIYDQNQLLKPPNNKVSRADMQHLARVWTAGAIEHIELILIEDIKAFFSNYAGRKVATYVEETAQTLADFKFQSDDLIIMGSEKEGLPLEIIDCCDAAVYLPALGHTSCLNVSVMLGIMLYAAQNQRID